MTATPPEEARLGRRRWGAWALSGVLGVTLASCTALLDASSYRVAEGHGDAGADSGAGQGTPAPCERNQECTVLHGPHWICRRDVGECRPLLSKECPRAIGRDDSDDAIVFGSIMPLEGPDRSTGIPIQNAIELALDDFRRAGDVPPIPGQSRRRPVVMVSCDDGSDGDAAERAARHLIEGIGVPAVIGGAFSGTTLRIATEVAIPNKTLLISPSATSIALTHLADSGFVWRTCPSDVIQADAQVALMPLLEADVRARLPETPGVRVAVVHKGDSYGVGLADAALGGLAFNGQRAIDAANAAYFRRVDFGDPHDPRKPTRYDDAVQEVVAFAPHVVFLLGTTETVTRVLPGIEAAWPAAADYRPQYVMADGSLIDETWQYLREHDPSDEKRRRILGTVPGTEGVAAQAFRHLYASTIRDGSSGHTAGAANAYDAVYNLVYAAVATGAEPLDGRNLAIGFGKLIPPAEKVPVGAAFINTAFRILLDGRSLDFEGASGPLDYDLSTGEAVSDVQIWCVRREGDRAASIQPSSMHYDATAQAIAGDFAAVRATCDF